MTKLKMLDELTRLYDVANKQGWLDIAEAIAIAENTVISEIDWSTAFDKWEAKK